MFGQHVNLLTDANPKLVGKSGTDIETFTPIYDNDAATAVEFPLGSEPLDLIFSFDDQAVAINRLTVLTQRLEADTACVEILVSTLSATQGYRSLQEAPLNASSKKKQLLNFVDSPAKWIMLRFTGLRPEASFKVAEVELIGHVGEPKETYKFDESPAEAIKVLSQLSNSLDVKFSQAESDMFEDGKDGKFDEISFAEASLLSCGVHDEQKRNQYLEGIEKLCQQATDRTSSTESAFEKGEVILKLLHDDVFRNGYKEQQTDVSKVLNEQTFNCVSSATLFNIVARKLGLDARGIEVPDHAFSILYDGTNHVDIETTNRAGFNPARSKAAIDQFQRQTGFVYIPERNRSSRREVGEPGLVAITYYNHGVGFSKNKRYNDALIQYFKALSLDPQNKSAVKNILSALANWSAQLTDEGEYLKATEVLSTGLALAPNDWRIKNNNFAVWQKYIMQKIDDDGGGDASEVLAQLKAVTAKTESKDLAKLQSMVYLYNASKLIKDKQWEEAIKRASRGIEQVDEVAQTEIAKWITNATLRWSNQLVESKEFSAATDTLAQAIDTPGIYSRWRLENQLAYVVQQWAADEKETNGEQAGRKLLNELVGRFPKLRKIKSVSSNFTTKAVQQLINEKDFEGALKLYAQARKQNPKDYQLKRNESAVWGMMAKPAMDARDWPTAIEIYHRAHVARPDEYAFKQNLAYVVQQWSIETAESKGVAAGEKIVSQWAEKLPAVRAIEQRKGALVSAELRKLVKAGDLKTAYETLIENGSAFPNKMELDKWATHICFQRTEELVNDGQWEAAISIYEDTIESFPSNTKIKQNLSKVWNSWALTHIDKQQWNKALEILEKANESVPNQSTISNNIRYCKSKLKQLKEKESTAP